MSPKEKAVLLVASMSFSKAKVADYVTGEMVDIPGNIYAKQCALIHVDEILQNFGTLTEGKQHYAAHCTIQFYKQVKQEIEKL